jgi:hypothetical protein
MNAYKAGVFAALYESEIGQRIWQHLNERDNLVRMETATALERPAAEGIEEPLLREFGEQVLNDRTKQMIGHMIRQIMEDRGYVIDVQNVKITTGAPFSRATRYKLPQDMTFHVFRHKADPRSLALAADKAGARLHSSEPGNWVYWKSFRGALRGRIAFGLDDESKARENIANSGFYIVRMERVVRAA